MSGILIFVLLGLAALTAAEKKNWDKIMKQANQNAQNVDEEDECAGKDVATLCEELAQFTPQLCSNDLAMEKCTEQCGDGKPTPELDCGDKPGDKKAKHKKHHKRGHAAKRIVNGTIADPGEWPWQALLQWENGSANLNWSFCGGAILSKHFILTAGHCPEGDIFPKNVYVGEHRRSTTGDTAEKVHQVCKYEIHEDYNSFTLTHDIALLQLKLPISIEDENKARICLPDDDNPVAEDQECYATGWGLLEHNGFPSDYLREVNVNRISADVCNDTNAYNGRIDETMTCAGFAEGQKDSCTNDSGGSLVCKVEATGKWYSTGIVSHGFQCARPHKYGVYADVAYFKDWIIETVLTKFSNEDEA